MGVGEAFAVGLKLPVILGVAFTVLFFVSAGLVRFVLPVSKADQIQIASPGVVGGRGAVERVA